MTQRNYFLSCPCFSLLEIQWYFFPCASFCVIEDNDAEEVSDNGIRSPDWELPALFCVPEWIFTPEVIIRSICAVRSHPSGAVIWRCQRAEAGLTFALSSCQERWNNYSWSVSQALSPLNTGSEVHYFPSWALAPHAMRSPGHKQKPSILLSFHKSSSQLVAQPRLSPPWGMLLSLAPSLAWIKPDLLTFWTQDEAHLFEQEFVESLR